MKFSRRLKVSCAVTIVAALAVPVLSDFPAVLAVVAISLAGPVFFFGLVRHSARGIVGRVGSRLLVSYLLIGILPLPFLLGLAYAVTYVFTGQSALRRAERAVHAKSTRIAEFARQLAANGPPTDSMPTLESLSLSDADRKAFPGLSLAFQRVSSSPRGVGELDTRCFSLAPGSSPARSSSSRA